jgi:hypothetical protein
MSYPQYTQQPVVPSSEESSSMKENATEAAHQGKQAVGEVAQSATERAGEVKDEAVRQARDLMGEAKNQVSQQAGQQHRALVSNLRSLGSELGAMSRHDEQQGVATELASQAQQRVSGLADWLESREPGQILDEVRDFARRRPGTFLVGALAAGMVAGRLARGAVEVHTGDDSGEASAAPVDPYASTYSPPTYSAPTPTPEYQTPTPEYQTPSYATPDQGTQSYPTNGSWQ